MAAVYQFVKQFGKNISSLQSNRSISLSATTRIKEIIEKKEGNTLTIEGTFVPHKKEHLLLKNESKACPVCAAGLHIKHTDVLILNQFVRSNGTMLPRRLTGLCQIQQKKMNIMVTMAQKAGLMPNLAPEKSKKDPKRRRDWKKFNTYYDEKTIKFYYNKR